MTREQALEAALSDLVKWAVKERGAHWLGSYVPNEVVRATLILGNHEVAEIVAAPDFPEPKDEEPTNEG